LLNYNSINASQGDDNRQYNAAWDHREGDSLGRELMVVEADLDFAGPGFVRKARLRKWGIQKANSRLRSLKLIL
jgi:hypothetical protein